MYLQLCILCTVQLTWNGVRRLNCQREYATSARLRLSVLEVYCPQTCASLYDNEKEVMVTMTHCSVLMVVIHASSQSRWVCQDGR